MFSELILTYFRVQGNMNSVGIPGEFLGNTGFSGEFGVWGGFGRFGASKAFTQIANGVEKWHILLPCASITATSRLYMSLNSFASVAAVPVMPASLPQGPQKNVTARDVTSLVGLRTQTQNAAFFERKGPECKPWPRGKPLKRKKQSQCVIWTLAFTTQVHKSQPGLSWGFSLGNLLPKTRVLERRVLERKPRTERKRKR